MERVTRQQLDKMVERINILLNRPKTLLNSEGKYNKGYLFLDYNRYYGGYRLVESDGVGEHHPIMNGMRFNAQTTLAILQTILAINDYGELERFPVIPQ